MTQDPKPPPQGAGRVYVLRVWREGAEPSIWRAVVREGGEGPRRYFASLDDCLEHLFTELSRR